MNDYMIFTFDFLNCAEPWVKIQNMHLSLTSRITILSPWYNTDVLKIPYHPIVLHNSDSHSLFE